MKLKFDRFAETIFFSGLAVLTLCSAGWAGPPAPPAIPATPVGSPEMTVLTVAAVAGFGYWKNRK